MIHEPHQDRAAATAVTNGMGREFARMVGDEAPRSERGETRAADRPATELVASSDSRQTSDPKSKSGRLSKRQRRRRRKEAGDAQPHIAQGMRDLPPVLGAKVAEAERALRSRLPAPPPTPIREAPPARVKNRRRRGAGARSAAVQTAVGHALGSVAPIGEAPRERTGLPASVAASVSIPVPAGPARMPAYAALDLGTNNCRLLVAVPTRPGQFRVIDAFSRIVRLGEGLGRTGSLAAGAMDRAVAALEICSQKLSVREIRGARLIATEACRAAANGEEFIERVRRETGLTLEIVSRETEARLAVSGCGSLVDRSAKGAVLFDIGGGSSEIALLDLRNGASRRLSNHIVAWTSLPVGVVSLAERHGGRDVTPELFERMIREVEAMIADFPGRSRLDDIVGRDGFHLLGTSGTVTTLAGVHLELERYDRRQVDGLWLTDAEVDRLVARIAGWSFEERIANPCIGSDRADLVLAGCAILEGIRRVWPARTLRVADRGLREGLLTEMMVADGVWRRAATAQARQTA